MLYISHRKNPRNNITENILRDYDSKRETQFILRERISKLSNRQTSLIIRKLDLLRSKKRLVMLISKLNY